MISVLTGLGYGIVTFAIIVGLGVTLLVKFGGTQAVCADGYPYNASYDQCTNTTDTSDRANPSDQAWTATNYMQTQLGSSGLAGWTGVIIVFVIAMTFMGSLMIGKGKSKGRY